MVIDISLLKENGVIDIDASLSIEVPPEYNMAESLVNAAFKGTVSLVNDMYILEGSVETEPLFKCDRCLVSVNYNLSFDIIEKFSREIPENDVDNEIWVISEHKIDLENCIKIALLSHMPMRMTCNEDCKGLCPKCGQDLNQNCCDCDNTNYDPRFEVLRSLLNEREV